MTDFSFIRLSTDFNTAKNGDNPNIANLCYNGLIVQQPNETFLQISNSPTDINFVGGIQVDLIDCNGLVVQNIDGQFFYEGFIDSNGIYQIAFEFGNIGVDYWTKPLYLKITDLVNTNIWYSNNFLVTYYQSDLTTKFKYTNPTKIYGISYDLSPYIQSVRLANCYDFTPVNKREVKQYVTSQGLQVNHRTITTFLRQYKIDRVDYFNNDRLEILFSHGIIYANNQRVIISDYSVEERKGMANVMSGEFTINPQNQVIVDAYQLYEGLEVVSLIPLNGGTFTIASVPSDFELTFNKDITLPSGFVIKFNKDGVLQTITPTTYDVTDNILTITPTYTFANGSYSIVIEPNTITSGSENFIGYAFGEWVFTIADGEFDNTQFSNEFLLN
jgi:hypothetical protein